MPLLYEKRNIRELVPNLNYLIFLSERNAGKYGVELRGDKTWKRNKGINNKFPIRHVGSIDQSMGVGVLLQLFFVH